MLELIGERRIMKSQKQRNLVELFILVFGGLVLSVHGVGHVASVVSTASSLPATAYGAGKFAGELIGALCLLATGLGLFVIASTGKREPGARKRAV